MGQIIRNDSHFVQTLPALRDNYIYVLGNEANNEVLAIDPGEAAPVLAWCKQSKKTISHILLTHHHPDHVGGVQELVQTYNCQVYASDFDKKRLPFVTRGLTDQETFSLLGLEFCGMLIPGHTLGHIAFSLSAQKWLFCGDTLFSLGCGRLFEGTPAQLMNSLQRLATLSPETLAFCGHEYTLANGEFALKLTPNNTQLNAFVAAMKKKRDSNLFTLPTTLADQMRLNPFYRTDDLALRKSIGFSATASNLEVFTRLRELRTQHSIESARAAP